MKNIKIFSLLFFFTMMGTMLTGCSSSDDDDDEIVNNGNNSGAGTNGENGANANKSPYKSWLYNPFSLKNTYIEMSTAIMKIELHLEAIDNTGTNWKILALTSSDGNYQVWIEESFYQYEIPTDPLWYAGTYEVGGGTYKHSYACMAKIKGSGWITIYGKAKISYSGKNIIIDINGNYDYDDQKRHILHYEGTFRK